MSAVLSFRQPNAATSTASRPEPAADPIERARAYGRATGLAYAGALRPVDAWSLVQAGGALLVDVRTLEERTFVGYVEGSLHVPWATGTSLNRNPRFVRELEAKTGKDATLVLLCRSGKRSAEAAAAAAKAGFARVFNVLEGFEGDLDAEQRRGGIGGWRFHGLPWRQE